MSVLEAAGVVSSIIQIADLGTRVALKLCTFCHKAKKAESNINIQTLSKDVSLTCTVLRQLGDNLRQDDQIQLYSPNAFETAHKISDECGRVFRSIEFAMDKGLSTDANAAAESSVDAKKSNPFLVLFKEPQSEVLQAKLDRLNNTMLLLLNVIIYANQLRKNDTQNSRDQRELIEVLVQQKLESDLKFDRLTRAIEDVKLDNSSVPDKKPVAKNTVGAFNNMPVVDSSAANDSNSSARSSRITELTDLPELTSDQFSVISMEIENYSGLIEGLLENLQTAEPHLAASRHLRIKQAILNAHARELQALTGEYGVKAGQLCAQFCQGPLFDKNDRQILQQIWKRQFLAAEARGEGIRKRKRGARPQEVEKVKSEEDVPIPGEEKTKLLASHSDPNRPDLETRGIEDIEGKQQEPPKKVSRRLGSHTLLESDKTRFPLEARDFRKRKEKLSKRPPIPVSVKAPVLVERLMPHSKTNPRNDPVGGLLARWTTLTANEFMPDDF